jgi:cobalt transporter subunit CbtB
MSKLINTSLPRHNIGSFAEARSRTVASVVSFLLGALIVYAMGFAPGRLHGAAHDSRHSVGLICH